MAETDRLSHQLLGQGYDAHLHRGKIWISTAIEGFRSEVPTSQQKVFQPASNSETLQRNQREHIAAT